MKSTNENAQGILSKARGYVARIALVIHCLELSLAASSPMWDTKISVDATKTATAIILHFNQQKFIMLGLNENPSDPQLSNRMVRLLTMTCKNGSGKITPSEVSQKHISERVGSSYTQQLRQSKLWRRQSNWDHGRKCYTQQSYHKALQEKVVQ